MERKEYNIMCKWGLIAATIVFGVLICSCVHENTKELVFPSPIHIPKDDSLDTLVPIDSTVTKVDKKQLKCDIWIKYSVSRCGIVNDCEDISYKEYKKIGDRVAKAANSGTQRICNSLGCPKRYFRKPEWSCRCKKKTLCIHLEVEFMCKK